MKYFKSILLILILVILDQLSKFYFISKNSFVENTGILFGLFKGWNLLFVIVSLVVIGVIIYFYKEKKLRLGFNFILSGAVSNLIDRIFRGSVVDFIDLKLWPVFNLGDLFIVLGVVILAWKVLRKS